MVCRRYKIQLTWHDDVVKKIYQDGMPRSAIKQHISEPLKLGSEYIT